MIKNRISMLTMSILVCILASAQSRWSIVPSGEIEWKTAKNAAAHNDHIEMSGKKVSVVLRYGVDEKGAFQLERSMIWPMLRTIPNNTHASLMQRFGLNVPSLLILNGQSVQNNQVSSIRLKGRMTISAQYAVGYPSIEPGKSPVFYPSVEITSTIFPSTDQPALCELYEVKNITKRAITVLVPSHRDEYKTVAGKGVEGSYTMVNSIQGEGTYTVEPGKSIQFSATIQAYSNSQKELTLNVSTELQKRLSFVDEISKNLVLVTPDSTINTAFNFAKLRASESIFDTKGGLMHGPGGESYYAAIWANDQAEYVGPFFPYLGYEIGNKSSINAYKHFARFMNPEYKPIPSSIIAEGLDTWGGAGDRGDAAMIAYGASRYALVKGSIQEAKELWPLIEWCLEFSNRKLTADGVVASDADELEGRFPAGKANLCTSTLYYDALISASYLSKELGLDKKIAEKYLKQSVALRKSINTFFGAKVEGFETYRYYKENTVLRSWICMPLIVGIFDRAPGTIDALFSPRLWTKDGLLTQAGSETFWDRSTLYALRGIYAAGETEKATNYLKYYSSMRLLGEHVPYPIEAWPEGSQRHLSAESGLYCRIITEGLFGIRPVGLKSFILTPHLPKAWDKMELNNMKGFGSDINILVTKANDKIAITVTSKGKVIFSKKVVNGTAVNITVK